MTRQERDGKQPEGTSEWCHSRTRELALATVVHPVGAPAASVDANGAAKTLLSRRYRASATDASRTGVSIDPDVVNVIGR